MSLALAKALHLQYIYGSWALLMSLLKDELMNSKGMKLNSFLWDTRSVDIKTSKC